MIGTRYVSPNNYISGYLSSGNPRVSIKQKALIAYRKAYFGPNQGSKEWAARLDRARIQLDRLGVSIKERNNALWAGPVSNPLPEEHLSAPAKAALWIGSIATIVGGAALLLQYLWPTAPETLNYKTIVFTIARSGGTWTGSFAYQNQEYSINGTSRDDIIAKVHNQIDELAG